MEWLVVLPYCFIATFWVMAPGLGLGWILRCRGWMLVCVAPVLSISVIGLAAIVGEWLGLLWGWVPVVAMTSILALVCWGVVWLLGRFFPATSLFSPTDAVPLSRWARIWPTLFGLGLAVSMATYQVIRILGAPENFSQTFDNLAHMNHVRWILDSGFASSLSTHSVDSPTPISPSFYPCAWHDVVSLVLTTLGSPHVAYGVNATAWVVVAIIWPLGCLFFIQQIMPRMSTVLRIASGILAACFAAFPTLLMIFGVLYPNFLANALLPGVMGLILRILGFSKSSHSIDNPGLIVILLGCLPGLFLAHPNAVLTLVAMVAPLVIIWGVRAVRNHPTQRWVYTGVTAGLLGFFMVIWFFGRAAAIWAAPNTSVVSLAEFFTASPLDIEPFWVLGILIVAGVVWIGLNRAVRWWLAPTGIVFLLWWAVSAWPGSIIRSMLTVGYYNDPYRLAAILPMVLFPLSVMGVRLFLDLGRRLAGRFSWWTTWMRSTALVLGALTMVVGVQGSPAMRHYLDWGLDHYAITDTSPLVTTDRYAIILMLPEIVEPGQRVATIPKNGGSMAYALVGVQTTTTQVFMTVTPDLNTIRVSLNEASTNPQVCEALANLNVKYALDFGEQRVYGKPQSYPGFDNLDQAEGFTLVAQYGEATLYVIDACDIG